MDKLTGRFVISLDFELFWGMTDKLTIKEYGPRILGERTAVPKMLKLFDQYKLHATWGTVGMLAFSTKADLLATLPTQRPHYKHESISNYWYIEHKEIGQGEETDQYHFGASLVELIKSHPNQEIASHTFSHYYCLEQGQTTDTFKADLEAEKVVLSHFNIIPRSLIFPRNQASEEYVKAAGKTGIVAYRGNERHVLYQARPEAKQSLFIRAFRLLDHYLPLSGHHTYTIEAIAYAGKPYNVAASRFLRQYMPRLSLLEPLRLARIKRDMTYAAKNSEVFHLWWHPHNMGIDQDENFRVLEKIAQHFSTLAAKYHMESATMGEIADQCTRL